MSDSNTNFTLERAENALLSRDFYLAARLYKSVLRDYPDNKEVLIKLGTCYVRGNQDEKALEPFLQVLRMENTNFEALNNLGGIYRRLGKYEESVKFLEAALKLGINTEEVNYNLGHTYKLMGYYDAAAESFYSVIEENPNDVLAYNHLGSIQAARGEYKKALQTYWRALQIDPNHPILHFNSAQSFAALEKYDDAIASYENALRTKPGWNEAIEGYSGILIKIGNYQKAEEILKSSIQDMPKNVKYRNLMGSLYFKKNMLEQAECEFRKILEIESENYETLNGLAKIFEKQGRYSDAFSILKQMEKIAENQLEILQRDHILRRQISALIFQNKLKEVANLLRMERKKHPENVEVLNLLAQFFIRSKEKHKELGCYKMIQNLEPSYISYLCDCGEQHLKIGNYKEAETMLRRYLDINPKDIRALSSLGLIEEKKQDYDAALKVYQSILELEPENNLALGAISKIGQKTGPDSKAMEIITEILNKNAEDSSALINESIMTYEETVKKLDAEPVQFVFEEEDVSEISKDIEEVFDLSIDDLFIYDMNEDIDFSEIEDKSIVLDEIDEETPVRKELDNLVPEDLPIDYVPQERETGFYNPFEGTLESNYSIDEDEGSITVDGDRSFETTDSSLEGAVPEEKSELILEDKKEETSPVIPMVPLSNFAIPSKQEIPSEMNVSPENLEINADDVNILENEEDEEPIEENDIELVLEEDAEEEIEQEIFDEELPIDEEVVLEDDLESEDDLEMENPIEDDLEDEAVKEETTFDETPEIEESLEEELNGLLDEETEETFIEENEADEESEITEEPEAETADKVDEEILEENQEPIVYEEELSLFKDLRDLCNFLPVEAQEKFSNSIDKIKLDCLIEKLSGNLGLLEIASSIRGKTKDSESLEDLSKDNVLKTLEYMCFLTSYLPNQQQATTLEREIARILQNF